MLANMTASGVTGSVASQSEGLMQDYKTGHIIGSTPRFLTYAQLIAVPVGARRGGVRLSAAARHLRHRRRRRAPVADLAAFRRARAASSPGRERASAPAPSRRCSSASGSASCSPMLESNPEHAAVGAVADRDRHRHAGARERGDRDVPRRGDRRALATRRARESYEQRVTPLASGFIAGEAIVAVLIPILVVIGLVHLQ